MFTIGIIRVITLESESLVKKHGEIVERILPNVKTYSKCIEDQPEGIYDEESEKKAIPKIVKLAKEMEGLGVNGIIVSCAGDPGIDVLEKELKIPVTGAGRPTASLALAISDKVGVLGITKEPPKPFKEVLRDYIVAYEKPIGVKTTLDLAKNIDSIIRAAKRLESAGAKVIALACTGFSTINAAPLIANNVNIPVIDPVMAAAITIYYRIVSRT